MLLVTRVAASADLTWFQVEGLCRRPGAGDRFRQKSEGARAANDTQLSILIITLWPYAKVVIVDGPAPLTDAFRAYKVGSQPP